MKKSMLALTVALSLSFMTTSAIADDLAAQADASSQGSEALAPAAGQNGGSAAKNATVSLPQTPVNSRKYGGANYYAPNCSPAVPKLEREIKKYEKLAEKYKSDAEKIKKRTDVRVQKIQDKAMRDTESMEKRVVADEASLRNQADRYSDLAASAKSEALRDRYQNRAEDMNKQTETNRKIMDERKKQVQQKADFDSQNIIQKTDVEVKLLNDKSEEALALAQRAKAELSTYKEKCVDRNAGREVYRTYRSYVRKGRYGSGRSWAGPRRTRPVINSFSDIEHVNQDIARYEEEIQTQHSLASYGGVVRNTNLKREKVNQQRRLEREIFHVH